MTKLYITITLYLTLIGGLCSQSASIAESVEYDPINNRFISSNDAVSMIQIDTMGNLTYFGQGLSSNLGMEIIGDNIFCVAATSQGQPVRNINVYDLTTETFVTSVTIDNALLLNGMASDGVSKVWVTDLQGQRIHEIDFADLMAPTVTEIAGGSSFQSFPNGITYDASQNRLVFVDWFEDIIYQMDLTDKSVSVALANTGTTNMDGIDMDRADNFYVSSSIPVARITRYSNDFSTSKILDIPGIATPADICIAKEINVLAIPSFQHNVILWKLEDTLISSTDNILSSDINIRTFPNPSEGVFTIEIEDKSWRKVNYEIFDIMGRHIDSAILENDGTNQFQIDISANQRGDYFINLKFDTNRRVSKHLHISY